MKHIVKLILPLFTALIIANSAIAANNTQETGNTSSATEKTSKGVTKTDPDTLQVVLEDYKKFVSKVPANIRDEIVAYRKEIANINKRKKALYKQLSEEAQGFLKQEQEFRKKLPIKDRRKLKMN